MEVLTTFLTTNICLRLKKDIFSVVDLCKCLGPSFSNLPPRQALFLPFLAVASVVCITICLFLHLYVRISRHVFALLKAYKSCKCLKISHFLSHFLQSIRGITKFLRLNIVHVSHCLTYQLFWIESRAGGNCLVCVFTFKQKLFKLYNFLFCSISTLYFLFNLLV